MEHLSHSYHQSKLSKRASHANAAPKSIYDDVFGGPPKFGVPTLSPRIEDYTEIFGGFHAPRVSSIPVLDLPPVDDQDAFFDARSSAFDYSEVFGGFNGLDFANGFEELVADQQRGGSICGSSDEAWTPAASECLSEETDHSGSNQCLSNGGSHHSYDENIEYTISYHKTNSRSDFDMSNGLRHASQMHAVPSFSYIVDQTNPSQVSGNVYQSYKQDGDDDCLDVSYNRKMVKGKHLKKTRSDTSNAGISGQGFSDDVGNGREYDRVSCCPDKGFVTITELNLRTAPSHLPPPSRPPPVLDAKIGYASGSGSSKKSASLEGTEGDSSPSFFDVEVDASSSAAAAASAAAMKETVAKARAQLRNAKELMERKQDGFQSRAKMASDTNSRDARRKHRKDEIANGSCQRESNGVKIPMVEENNFFLNAGQQNPVKTQGKELLSPKVAAGLEDGGEWKEATQFFELVKNERPKVSIRETDREKQSSERSNDHDNGLEEVKLSEVYRGHENSKNKEVKEVLVIDVKERREYHQAEYGKPSISKEASIRNDREKKDKEPLVVGQQEEAHAMLNAICHSQQLKLNSSTDSDNCERLPEVQTDVGKFEVRQLMGQKKYDPNLTESSGTMMDGGSIWEQHGAKGTLKRKTEVSALEEEHGIFRTVLGQGEKEKGQQKLSEQVETERRRQLMQKSVGETNAETEMKVPAGSTEKGDDGKILKKTSEREHIEGITEAHDMEEHERRLSIDLNSAEKQKRKEAAGRDEKEKRLEEALVSEEGEQRLQQFHRQEDGNKLSEDNEREETDKREREAIQLGDLKRRQEEASDHEEKKRRQWQAFEKEEKEKVLKEVRKLEEKEKKQHKALERQEDKNSLQEAWRLEERVGQAYEREGTVKVSQTLEHREENEKNIKEDFENDFNHRHAEASHTHEVKAYLEQEFEQEEIDDALQETFELEQIDFELSEGTYFGESGVFDEARKKDETCKQNDIVEWQLDDLAAEVPRKPLQTIDAFIDLDNGISRNQSHSGDGESAVDEMERIVDGRTELSGFAEVVLENGYEGCGVGDSLKLPSDNGLKAALATGIVIEGTEFVRSSVSQHQQGKASVEQGDKEKNISQAEVHINEEMKDKFASSGSTVGESKKGSRMDLLQSDACNTQRTSQLHATETESRKENLNRTVTPEEKDAERVRKDQELEKDRLRKIEEEREREREREKDRMAVDRAILEARERAFSEARERPERAAVERANAGSRQRSLMEARERLEKLCAEAKERSMSDKDAKTRAERAIVERAMAEARQRAAEKTVYEGRERVDRSLSEKFSAPRYNGMRQSSLPSDFRNSQDQAIGSSSTSRHQYSSGYVASSSTRKPEGDEGESAQRCKARLERHRRTAERAAKALAEKNMRDLLAQREQAERNRLAETLDGEVKRWSSGKEGNLRALLSTLQYILGPGSGWQPIPLTEVITSVAVKKAYRKATLCVHPDKLQQRGASIQQKYICEKVFDLLKEAWNKFNNEER